jgi:hypothetical protein
MRRCVSLGGSAASMAGFDSGSALEASFPVDSSGNSRLSLPKALAC